MKPGEVWTVRGHGLMLIVDVARSTGIVGEVQVVTMRGHGPQRDSANHWFPASRLSTRATDEVIRREFLEARARNVSCTNPDCWCIARRGGP